jgi:hypothetical protein
MLREIKNLFNEHRTMNLKELAIHFQAPKSMMEGMLQKLVRKRIIKKTAMKCTLCGCGYGSCDSASTKDMYSLIESTV